MGTFRTWLEMVEDDSTWTDETGFIGKYHENPDDRTTWLVYADWLDEHDRHYEASVWRAMAGKQYFFYRETFAGNAWPPVIINSALQQPRETAQKPPVYTARLAVVKSGAAIGHDCDGINLNSYTLQADTAPAFRDRVLQLAQALNLGEGFRPTVVEICNRTEGYVQEMIDGNPTYAYNMNGMGATPQTEARRAAKEWGDLIAKYVGKRIHVRRNSPRRV